MTIPLFSLAATHSAALIAMLFVPYLFNAWGIWHVYFHTFPTPQERLLWLVLCVLVPGLGGIIYALFGMRRAHKPRSPDQQV